MQLINCLDNLILTCSANWVFANKVTAFVIIEAKRYVPVETLSTQDNLKTLIQLKPGVKRTINWNEYQSKVITQAQSQYLD